ncbi:hypothetical protein KCP74_23600 [Salmonella enterica subsp. enterica]|nr:hypothetical protein KCP74_23600 [Salmonella enterica subsp. enterica]
MVIAGIVALFLSRALNSLSLGSDTRDGAGGKVARAPNLSVYWRLPSCAAAQRRWSAYISPLLV